MRFTNIVLITIATISTFASTTLAQRAAPVGLRGRGGPPSAVGDSQEPASRAVDGLMPLTMVPSSAVPAVERATVEAEDARRESQGMAPRFAIKKEVNVSPMEDGTWEELDDGTQVWRHRIESHGCNSLTFGFGEYEMPAGGELFISAANGETMISRPFTDKNNGTGQLWTPIIASCDVVIEVNLQANTNRKDLKLSLTSVQVGYRINFVWNPKRFFSCLAEGLRFTTR